MSKFDLKDKVAIITGAAGGIGTELSREFLSAGAKVVLASRNLESLSALQKELNNENTLIVETDITDPDSTQSMVCLLYTSPSPRDVRSSRMPSSA